MSRAVIFVNGLLPQAAAGSQEAFEPVRRLFRSDDVLLAADGGAHYARMLGLTPSAIIGDLDSMTEGDRQWAEANAVRLVRYSQDKDETDLELALQYAVGEGHREILLVGALGRRLDQTLGNLSLLTAPSLAELDVRADDGVEELFFTRSRCQVRGSPGDLVSLIPWGGEVSGITTAGLRWPLHGERLHPDKTRGISNELLNEAAAIEIASGLLLVVHRRDHQP